MVAAGASEASRRVLSRSSSPNIFLGYLRSRSGKSLGDIGGHGSIRVHSSRRSSEGRTLSTTFLSFVDEGKLFSITVPSVILTLIEHSGTLGDLAVEKDSAAKLRMSVDSPSWHPSPRGVFDFASSSNRNEALLEPSDLALGVLEPLEAA